MISRQEGEFIVPRSSCQRRVLKNLVGESVRALIQLNVRSRPNNTDWLRSTTCTMYVERTVQFEDELHSRRRNPRVGYVQEHECWFCM